MTLSLLLAVPASADQANVFVYHRFNDARYPSTNISREDFQTQLEFLQQQEFTVFTLGQVVASIQRGVGLPPRCAVITVDDAYRSFLTEGWPLLQKFGYPATLFVSTDTVGGADYLTWRDLAMLQGEGVEIGNHSASHAYLLDRLPAESDAAWSARISADIMRSQQAFKDHLGAAPQLFAYPYGEFDPQLVALVKSAGFTAAFGQQSGVITADQDVYRLPRFPAGDVYGSFGEFRSKLFMRHLPVRVVSPGSTLIERQNPPLLRFALNLDEIDSRSLRCFVPGLPDCKITKVTGIDDLYEVQALQPLAGRRSKYTVTASDASGRTWYWFSQLWVLPGGSEMTDHSVAR